MACNKEAEYEKMAAEYQWPTDLTIHGEKIVLKLKQQMLDLPKICTCNCLYHFRNDERVYTYDSHQLLKHLLDAVGVERMKVWLKERSARQGWKPSYEDDIPEVFSMGSAFFHELMLKLTTEFEADLTTVTLE